MQPPLPTSPQPEPENNCPDCLYLKLIGIPVQPGDREYLELWQTSTYLQQIDLYLTIKFNEQWAAIGEGRVKFGLKGGELRLRIEGGELPYESRQLAGSIELEPPKPRQAGAEVPPGTQRSLPEGSSMGTNFFAGQAQPAGRTPQSLPTVCQITIKVSEEHPVWVFEEVKGEPILKGSLHKIKLGRVDVLALPCRIEATFEVSRRDICLTETEGLWPPAINRNRRAVLDRLIIQRLLEPKLMPYLSRVELQYD